MLIFLHPSPLQQLWHLDPADIISRQRNLLIVAGILILCLLITAILAYRYYRAATKKEANLREINQRVMAVVNNTDSLIVSLDHEMRIRLISKSAQRFFEKWASVKLERGDRMLKKLHKSPVLEQVKSWHERSRQLNGWREVSQIKVGDRQQYLLENFSTIRRPDGEFAGMVMVANDITTEHEYNLQLTEQRDYLQRSDHAKKRMLSILAHDLKDAIYSAHSVSGLVHESPESFSKEELQHLFELLHNNFDKTKSLLEGLLEWMKTQTNDLTPRMQTFDLHQTAEEVVIAAQERLRRKGIELKLDIPPETMVSADHEMVKTVLRNLLSNAIKYTRPKEGQIQLKSKEKEGQVEVHVKDNGEGIAPENHHKLFKNPGQFSTPGTANEHGTGFGLSLCYELLQLNKSHLHLKSAKGKGSDFYFSLKLAHQKALK